MPKLNSSQLAVIGLTGPAPINYGANTGRAAMWLKLGNPEASHDVWSMGDTINTLDGQPERTLVVYGYDCMAQAAALSNICYFLRPGRPGKEYQGEGWTVELVTYASLPFPAEAFPHVQTLTVFPLGALAPDVLEEDRDWWNEKAAKVETYKLKGRTQFMFTARNGLDIERIVAACNILRLWDFPVLLVRAPVTEGGAATPWEDFEIACRDAGFVPAMATAGVGPAVPRMPSHT